MDQDLLQRLELFRMTDTVPPGVADFVASELEAMEAENLVTEATAGMLTSHLVMALSRMVKEEPDIDPPSPAVIEEVRGAAPQAFPAAAAVSDRSKAVLGVPLSIIEQHYLALHLATLAMKSKEK